MEKSRINRFVCAGRGRCQIGDRVREKHEEMGEPSTTRGGERRREAEDRVAPRSAWLQVLDPVLPAAHAQHPPNTPHALEEVQLGGDRTLHRRATSLHRYGQYYCQK